MNGKRLTTQQVDRIVYLYVDKGISAYEIARRIGSTNHTVARVLKRRGIYIRPREESYDNMRGPRTLPDDVVKQIVEMHENGLTIRKIEERLHRAGKVISRTLRERGIFVGHGNQKLIPVDGLFRLYWRRGLSMRDVAKEMNVSYPTIRRYMKLYGILRRKHKGRNKVIPKDDVTRILKLYEDYSIANVAKITKHSFYVVRRVLRENGVEIKWRPRARKSLKKKLSPRPLRRLRIISRWKEGADVHTIADEFDMDHNNVMAIIGRWYRRLEPAED